MSPQTQHVSTAATLRPHLFHRLRQATAGYPRSFWILFWGMLIQNVGISMVWPFLTIYIRQRLAIPLTTVTLLFTLNSLAGLASTSLAGPIVDRFGRKGVMVVGLAVSSVVQVMMSIAGTMPLWGIVMAASGAVGLLYRVGADAMVADMIEPDRRAGAYALLRMGANLGVAIGPSVGGFVTARSYALAFYIAAGAQAIFAMLVLSCVGETLPQRRNTLDQPQGDGGYGRVLRNRPFLAFCGIYTLTVMAYVQLMVLLPVYGKENFHVPENQFGFIMATNAALVVLFQYAITHVTRRYRHAPVLAAGALFYALGVGSVAWGWNFPTFLVSMVVLTVGEMIMIPTSTALTANLAPPDMRGRYMGVYSLTWSVGFGLGPVVGGLLNDHVAPVAMWYGGMALGLAAAVGFVALGRWLKVRGDSSLRSE
ncbi:MAG TPA: MFS transporter [Anaerolineae bacterium]|nr:MFS transporter [Anaerolineae bacterium]